MELSANHKKWLWNNDSDSKKIRNASLEKAEEMADGGERLAKKQIGQAKSFFKFFILRFRCEDCKTYHFWGGTRKYMMGVDFQSVCPEGSKRIHLNKKFDDVPRRDALKYSPHDIRQLIFQDEFQANPFK